MTDSRRSPRPTLTDVAAAAGVSLKTVSRVINGIESVNDDMTRRVHEAADRLGYRRNKQAAMLRTGRSGMVAMIVRDLTNPFYAALAAGAGPVVESHDSLLVVASAHGSPDRQSHLLDGFFDHRVDGLMLTPAEGSDPALAHAVGNGTPVVGVDIPPDGIDIDTVILDNYRGAYEGVRAAAESGYRRFAFILHTYEQRTMQLRADGARAALDDLGIPLDPALIRTGSDTAACAGALATELLLRDDPPECIFCANNVVSLGVASTLRQHRADIALVAFDDFPLSATLSLPVWVIDHDPQEMGATAARLLFERMKDPALPPRTVTVPTTVRPRGDRHADPGRPEQ